MSAPAAVSDARRYPARPWLAVSAAIFRDGRVLLVRRAREPARGRWTLPGGGVELGETLHDAVRREVAEETGLAIDPIGIAGHRDVIVHDGEGRVERHFVVLAFAALSASGEPVLDAELDAFGWHDPAALESLSTTDGLADIVAAAESLIG